VGAKNSAAEAVVRLARVEADVTVCHRGEGFDAARVKPWLLPEIHSLIAEQRAKLFSRVVPIRIEPGLVVVRYIDGSGEFALPFDKLFLLTGYHQDNSLFQELGVQLIGDEQRPALNPETMETNVPGVFVAGTATAGTQLRGVTVFIENCHRHAGLIRSAIAGGPHHAHAADRPVEFREI
jgi:thioredoxin reductase (NADPH)